MNRSDNLELVQFPFEYIYWFGLCAFDQTLPLPHLSAAFPFAHSTKKLLLLQSPNHWDLMALRDHFIGHHIHISALHIGGDDHP